MIWQNPEKVRTSKRQVFALFALLALFGFSFWMSQFPPRTFGQLDKGIHTLSGASLALLFMQYAKKKFHLIWFVFLIGFIFEIAEFLVTPVGAYGGWKPYLLDTLGDLTGDVVGASIIVIVSQSLHKKIPFFIHE